MEEKTFDELINETNELINKLSSPNIPMDDAMSLFETGIKNLKLAKEKLQNSKSEIKKILEDNHIEDLEA